MATVIKKGASKKEVRDSISKAIKGNPALQMSELAGKLKSKVNPLEYQKKVRDEWKQADS